MSAAIKNTFTQKFNLKIPIAQGPMAGVSGPHLTAAVANTGALGILPIWDTSAEDATSRIEKTKALTNKPFGVNLRADVVQNHHISAALNAGVTILHFFWGSPSASMRIIKGFDIQMIATVEDRTSALMAIEAGATALIAQGTEAGGHSRSEIPLTELLDMILDVAGKIPVIAAGGCTNGNDANKLLKQGASGILYGTRFAASQESEAHDMYKEAILKAGDNDTVRSLCFDGLWPNAPHRTLINSTFKNWDAAGRPTVGSRPGEGDIIMHTPDGHTLPRYLVVPPKQGMTGNIQEAAMYAGMGVGKIHDCPTCKNIIAKITTGLLS